MEKIGFGIGIIIWGIALFICGMSIIPELKTTQKYLQCGNFKVLATLHEETPERVWVEIFMGDEGVGFSLNHNLDIVSSMSITKSSRNQITLSVDKNQILIPAWPYLDENFK